MDPLLALFNPSEQPFRSEIDPYWSPMLSSNQGQVRPAMQGWRKSDNVEDERYNTSRNALETLMQAKLNGGAPSWAGLLDDEVPEWKQPYTAGDFGLPASDIDNLVRNKSFSGVLQRLMGGGR
jgi:hypothetical protein